MKKMKTIQSSDYDSVLAEEFEVLVDPHPASGAPSAIGLMVRPVQGDGAPFIMPIEFGTALTIAENILDALAKVAPHLILGLLKR